MKISPGDRPRWILDKVGEYFEAGVRLVWVIDPKKASAAVYLEGGDVVPGFRCQLREILGPKP